MVMFTINILSFIMASFLFIRYLYINHLSRISFNYDKEWWDGDIDWVQPRITVMWWHYPRAQDYLCNSGTGLFSFPLWFKRLKRKEVKSNEQSNHSYWDVGPLT